MRVLFATDGSEPSRAAMEFLLRLPFTPEDRFIILHVLKEFVLPDTIDPNREFRKAGKAGALQLVLEVAEKFRAAGFHAVEAVREGDPAREVAEALEEFEADLAVLGHKGQTDFQRFLLGNVSHHVLRQGKRSVLIVRDLPPARPIKVLYCTDGSTHARFARDLF
ncbi:MAG: universal stress protein, partial [Nitrospirota bacterium]